MTTAQLLISRNSGPWETGGVIGSVGDVVTLGYAATSGVRADASYYELYGVPPDYPVPSGWTDKGNGTWSYSLTGLSPTFTIDRWGKYMTCLRFNGAADSDQGLVDFSSAISVLGTASLEDVGRFETSQFHRDWSEGLRKTLRAINMVGGGLIPDAVPASKVWRQKADGTIPVQAHAPFTCRCYPWLCVGNGTTDDTAAMSAYFTAMMAAGLPIVIPAGNYKITAALPPITADGTHIYGEGAGGSVLLFDPGAEAVCLQFGSSATHPATVTKAGVHHLTIQCSATTVKRTAIKTRDISEFKCLHCSVNFSPAGDMSGSIGVDYGGRDHFRFHDLTLGADTPLRFSKNPNVGGGIIDADAGTIDDLYLTCTRRAGEGGKCIEIADGWANGPIKFGGAQAWVRGDYGLYWYDSTAVSGGQDLTLDLGRWEGGTSVDGWGIYIVRAGEQGMNRLTVRNFVAAPVTAQGGLYIRGCSTILENCKYVGYGTALNIDETVGLLTSIHNDWYALGGLGVNFNGTVHKIFSVDDANEGERLTVYGPSTTVSQVIHLLGPKVDLAGQNIRAASSTEPSSAIGISGDIAFCPDPAVVGYWVKDGSLWYKAEGHYFEGVQTWDMTAALIGGAEASRTITTVQCAVGDIVDVAYDPPSPARVVVTARVSATNEITLEAWNRGTPSVTWGSVSVYLRIRPKRI